MANLILWATINHNTVTLGRQIGPHLLASWLRSKGYTVKVIDFCHQLDTKDLVAITEKHIDSTTKAIGVSTIFWTPTRRNTNAFRPLMEPEWVVSARSLIESKHKDLHWLLGAGDRDFTSDVLKYNWIIFKSYAEDQLLNWMNNQYLRFKKTEPFDIKTFPMCFDKSDTIRPHEVLPIEIARGCKFRCKFCAFPLNGKKDGDYIKDFRVLKEMFIRNYNEFGTTRYAVMDDTVNESVEKIEGLARIAQSLPFELSWIGYARLDLIAKKPSTIQSLKDSGLKSALFGIESFHPTASAVVGKGWNGKHGKEFLIKLKDAWKDDVNWQLAFIAGLPGEPPESIIESINWCVENKMHSWYLQSLGITPFENRTRKSEFDLDYIKYGYSFPDKDDPYNWHNEIWTRDQASKLCLKLLKDTARHMKFASWDLLTTGTLGYDFKKLMKTNLVDITEEHRAMIVRAYLKAYVSAQLKN